ncbi:MAG: hypothetical protein AAF697_06200 [Pseudomonadota bacterium]
MGRINAAIERIDNARAQISEASEPSEKAPAEDSASSARVMALVNAHEKLREEVAETIGQIDTLIEELEG